jgi:prepilin-type N-terminal cleavage/methylation domain-containing protein
MTVPRMPRVRREEGFTLVEMLIAMMILSVAILPLVAAYSSGYVALNRATQVSSATLIADSQMERFRALQYTAIKLNTSCGTACAEDTTYTGDAAYSASTAVTGCSTTDTSCLPTQTKTGPDGRSYRVDTFISWTCATGTYSAGACSSGQTPVKLVTVVVRKSGVTASWIREQSIFTSLTGS